MKVHVLALLFVCLLVTGQMLFRASANAVSAAGTYFAPRPILVIGAAFALYGVASLLWIGMLRTWRLGEIYPYVGLSFIFVPIAAHLIFGDAVSWRLMLGALVIGAGVVIAVSA